MGRQLPCPVGSRDFSREWPTRSLPAGCSASGEHEPSRAAARNNRLPIVSTSALILSAEKEAERRFQISHDSSAWPAGSGQGVIPATQGRRRAVAARTAEVHPRLLARPRRIVLPQNRRIGLPALERCESESPAGPGCHKERPGL